MQFRVMNGCCYTQVETNVYLTALLEMRPFIRVDICFCRDLLGRTLVVISDCMMQNLTVLYPRAGHQYGNQ